MILSRYDLNAALASEGLLPITFRISMEYGEVEIAISPTINYVDLFGHVVNYCAKMNSMSLSYGVVIGESLYKITATKAFLNGFKIEEIPMYSRRVHTSVHSVYVVFPNVDSGRLSEFGYKFDKSLQ